MLGTARESSFSDRRAMRDGETAADDDLAATVEALKTGKGTILWDSELLGFGLRLSTAITRTPPPIW